VGNQDLLQRLNRQEVASEQETSKKPPRNRQRHPFRGGGSLLFELPGEEFAKRRNSKPARSHNPEKAWQKRFTASRREQNRRKCIDDKSNAAQGSSKSSPTSIEFGSRSFAKLRRPQEKFEGRQCILVSI
jgi:hypothetical protein